MKVVRISDVKPEEAVSPLFSGGKVTRQGLVGENDSKELLSSVVNFNPGTVNKFHTHTHDQLLIITEGKGIVATESEEITVTPGTVILFPAGEKHWHGATKDSSFSHIYVILQGSVTDF